MKTCPRGCDAELEYIGTEDGFGDNGDMACDVYQCPSCGEQVIGDCMEIVEAIVASSRESVEWSYECSMCGKDMPRSKTGRCSSCEQVWNG